MNELEKRSFYSFLGLYILSSFLFLTVIGYWYYAAQKSALENETYYRLQHSADVIAGEIIMAHMQHRSLKKPAVPRGIDVALVATDGKIVQGEALLPTERLKPGYYTKNGARIFVSDAPKEHLGIAYVITLSRTLDAALKSLRERIVLLMGLIALLIVLVAWVLSRIFMRPVRERVAQVERFINDITHELNTPISSLSMATDQALKKGECTEKTLKNISISTRQLYDIYRSLTYLNFRKAREDEVTPVEIDALLEKSVAYYRPLAEVKRIDFALSLSPCSYPIPEAQATLLFGNLIGNAIKYSSPNSTITIDLHHSVLKIKDEGIGIAPEKQQEIFEKFRRGTEYSGGFGVGLSIVKHICMEYGIGITLDSVPGEGTEFRLSFGGTL
jgi:two-component system OmpR family sensor kinase